VVVQLSGRVSASVMPGAMFQYAQFEDCGSFATSALGDVALFDRETGETIPVLQGSVSYNAGSRVDGGLATRGTFSPVGLAWESDAKVELRGGGASYPISGGTEQTLRLGDSELTAAHGSDGALALKTLVGNLELKPAFLPDFSIEIPEGGGTVLRLDRQRMIFSAQATPDSSANLRVIYHGETYMFLSGDARVTVVLGQNSLSPEGSPAWIFFEGAGGDTSFTSGPQPGTLISPNRIDASRILQEPVSVIE
jgi:hypothetical protein